MSLAEPGPEPTGEPAVRTPADMTDRELLMHVLAQVEGTNLVINETAQFVQEKAQTFLPDALLTIANRVRSVPLIGGALATALEKAVEDFDSE